jgi:aspartate kinase
VRADLAAGKVVIITGFQGIDGDGNITTLGRGGSDTSAVAVAAAMKADECLIYTDVDGVYTTDPRVVPEARRLHTISFEEMLEMASLGSKVLQIRSVEFAGKYRVPLRVLSSFTPWDIDIDEEAVRHPDHLRGRRKDGTSRRLGHRVQPRRSQDHRGRRARQARHRLPDPGPGGRGQHRRRRDHPERVARRQDRLLVHRAPQRLPAHDGPAEEPVLPATGAARCGRPAICKVSIVGIGMKSHVGVASTMFRTLAKRASTSR